MLEALLFALLLTKTLGMIARIVHRTVQLSIHLSTVFLLGRKASFHRGTFPLPLLLPLLDPSSASSSPSPSLEGVA